MERVFLARHALAQSNEDGLASYAAPGEGLTEKGVAQARNLALLLACEEVALGVATELRRTQETLELALDGRAVPRIIVSELNEIHFGSFDGGLLSAYRDWAGSEAPTLAAPGGGESRAQAAARYSAGLRIVLARPEPSALVVGHALAVRYVVDAARGLAPAPLMLAPVEHALPHVLSAEELETAVDLLESWSLDPRFRDPS
ncbi:MAG: histidine phosphatase family protein [Actinobacteria bacterium]|nr:histidine phosphatase family protein [Actinomycetota bacterium]